MKFILENKKGLFLCITISIVSYIFQYIETLIFNSKIFDVLIISLLIGILVENIPKNMFPMKHLLSKKRRECGKESLKCHGIIENLIKIKLQDKRFVELKSNKVIHPKF